MSLDVSLIDSDGDEIFAANITHNLARMASEAGIYESIWRPEIEGLNAGQVYERSKEGVWDILTNPEKYKEFDSPNGWGLHKNFAPWLVEYMAACRANPECNVEVSR